MAGMRIEELTVGSEILCYMRLGLALGLEHRGDGSTYYKVPDAPKRSTYGNLNKFLGFVVLNQPDRFLLSVQVSRTNWNNIPYRDTNFPILSADIPYSAFSRVRRFSDYAYEASRPHGFSYRTLTEVRL